jgi:hypothetical protein
MGKNKGLGIGILVLGIVLLVGGLVVKFVVLPSQAKFPADVDTTRVYDGEFSVLMNAAALQTGDLANLFYRDLPITIDRTVKTLEVGGNDGAIVSDHAVVNSAAGPVAESLSIYAIDRTTMEAIDDFSGDARVIHREGLVIGWPIGSEPTDYIGWNGDTMSPTTIKYVGEEERAGVKTYKYHATSEPKVIVDPELLAQFPAGLPKDLLMQLAPMLGIADEQMAQLGPVLEAMPDPVPLTYTFAYDKTYWIEPTTGILIDIDVMESRAAALTVPGAPGPVPLAEVQHLEYVTSPASVQDAVNDANTAISQLNMFGTYIPALLILFGLIGIIGGIYYVWVRKPEDESGDAAAA